jgi:hypothetical protein
MVADVFWKAGQREWKVARVVVRPGYSGGIGLMPAQALEGFDARVVDVILRTVEGEEPDSSWPSELWRGEVKLHGVEVRWYGDGP